MTPEQMARIKDRIIRGLGCSISEACEIEDEQENQTIIDLFEQGVIDVVQTQ